MKTLSKSEKVQKCSLRNVSSAVLQHNRKLSWCWQPARRV